jgi:hypothetical protein
MDETGGRAVRAAGNQSLFRAEGLRETVGCGSRRGDRAPR